MFYIKWLKITANDGESRLMFEPGLNIIYGPSNSGKSMVLDCIDYMMGAKESSFDSNLKVQNVAIGIDANGNALSISREVNSQEFEVISHVEGIKPYPLSRTVSKSRTPCFRQFNNPGTFKMDVW